MTWPRMPYTRMSLAPHNTFFLRALIDHDVIRVLVKVKVTKVLKVTAPKPTKLYQTVGEMIAHCHQFLPTRRECSFTLFVGDYHGHAERREHVLHVCSTSVWSNGQTTRHAKQRHSNPVWVLGTARTKQPVYWRNEARSHAFVPWPLCFLTDR